MRVGAGTNQIQCPNNAIACRTAVRLGEWDIDSDQDCVNSYGERVCADPVQDIAIEKYIVHPGYAVQKQSVKNDIAQG